MDAPPPNPTSSRTPTTREWWPDLLLILALTVVAYLPALRGEFQLDDGVTVFANANLDRLGGADGAWRAGPMGRQLTHLTLALNYRVGGLNPGGYHLTNLALHLCVVVLVFFAARRLFGRAGLTSAVGTALAAAGIFGLHPLHTQAVSYIAQRSEVMATLFFLASLLLLLRADEPGRRAPRVAAYCAAVAAFVLALYSKPTAITLPAAYFLVALVVPATGPPPPAGAVPSPWRFALGRVLFIAPCLAVAGWAALASAGHVGASRDVGFQMEDVPAVRYLLTQPGVILSYLRLLVVPVGQSIEHDVPLARSLAEASTFASAAAVVLLGAAAAVVAVRFHAVQGAGAAVIRVGSFGVLFFFVALAPTSSFVPVADLMFEHRVYPATWGLIAFGVLLGGVAVDRLAGHWAPRFRRVLLAAMVALTWVALGSATFVRNRVWRTTEALWTDAVVKSPGSARAHAALAAVLEEKGEHDAAERHARRALDLNPKAPLAHTVLGIAEHRRGDHAAALAHYVVDLGRLARKAWVLNSLGCLYDDMGQPERAQSLLEQALVESPRYVEAHYNLGMVLEHLGRPAEAEASYRRALALRAGHVDALKALGNVMYRSGRFDEAARSYEAALQREPRAALIAYDLALAYASQGRMDQAREALLAALRAGFKDHARLAESDKLRDLTSDPAVRQALDARPHSRPASAR